MVGTGSPQVPFDAGDLCVQLVDEPERRLDVAPPRLGELQTIEQLAAAHAEEVGHRTGMAEGHEAGVDPVLERRAVLHEVQAEAGPLSIGAHRGTRQPDGRDEVAP